MYGVTQSVPTPRHKEPTMIQPRKQGLALAHVQGLQNADVRILI